MKYFRLTILFLILAEILSFCSFVYPVFNKACFITIIILAIFLSLEKLEYGVYLVLAELFIGSFGYLFFYETGGISISLRLGLFLIVMSVWIAGLFTDKPARADFIKKLGENKFLKYYFIFFLFLAWGVIWGMLRKNGLNNIFFDANSYIYFALIFPFLYIIKEKEHLKAIFEIFIASMIVLSFKTLFLLFIFSHKMRYAMEFLYKWTRDFRLGEITLWKGGFYRIFFQSHIYVLIALFFVAIWMALESKKRHSETALQGGRRIPSFFSLNPVRCLLSNGVNHWILHLASWVQYDALTFLFFILFFAVMLIGMSRSFWVGGFFAVIAMYAIFIFRFAYSWKKTAKFTLQLALGAVLSLVLIFLIVKFPYPKESADFSASLLSERASSISGEAGASSRWNLLPVLAKAITVHQMIGSGFGSTITYKSGDPRVLKSSPNGEYTTYAFEWGYLDIILKIGLAGMLAYLFLIFKILQEGWKFLFSASQSPSQLAYCGETMAAREDGWDIRRNEAIPRSYDKNVLGYILGMVVILATSVFSPYMNHPLGIGYIVLCSTVMSIDF